MRSLKSSLLLLLLSACVNTPYYSFTDPGYKPEQPIKHIMVQAANFDIQAKEIMEKEAAKELQAYTDTTIRHIDLFLPTREYTEEETKEIIKKNDIDAILVVSIMNKGITTDHSPHFSYYGYIGIGSHRSYRSRSHIGIGFPFYSGHNSINQSATFEGVLFDARTDQKIWITSLELEASNHKRLASQAGKTIVDRLAKDGIILKSKLDDAK